MGIAVIVFGLLVGIFHYQGGGPAPTEQHTLSAKPAEPASYGDSAATTRRADVGPQIVVSTSYTGPYTAMESAQNIEQLAQGVADIVTAKPSEAAATVTLALAQIVDSSTLGDVALIAATATKAAPTQAPAIAGAVARSVGAQSKSALAAAIATIVSLVPEQAGDVGMIVGAVIGNDPDALAMVAQTIAISVGREAFSSLSEGSGVSMTELMKRSSSLGVLVPFDVPNFAAQFAPSASMVADSADSANAASQGAM
jgi:hypothetical protein